MLDALRTMAAFAVDLSVLIFFHELGHYLAARSQGVVVETFSIGFGPALLAWRAKSGTVWQISALPLGGYVKMQGWGETEDTAPKSPGSFAAARLGSKALIVAAGPFANLVLACVLLTGLFIFHGQPQDMQPTVSKVVAHSAAANAGLQPGDRIVMAGGKQIKTFDDLLEVVVPHPDADLPFQILRAGHVISEKIQIGQKSEEGETIGSLGIYGPPVVFRRLSPPAAFVAGVKETASATAATAVGIYNLIVHLKGLHQLHGVIGIAQITGQAAAYGLASLVDLVAMISINLGLVNLIPIPVLDGGHLLSYAIEALLRRPIPARVQEAGLRFGVAVIISLILVTNFNDLTRMGALNWVAHLFG